MSTTRTQQIALAVKTARHAKGLTQVDLADACGVHAQTIGNLERARHEPSAELLTKVGSVLGIGLTAAALAASESVINIKQLLYQRLRELDDIERLTLVADTLHYVAGWQPGDSTKS